MRYETDEDLAARGLPKNQGCEPDENTVFPAVKCCPSCGSEDIVGYWYSDKYRRTFQCGNAECGAHFSLTGIYQGSD
jgi:hypothetical protein